MEDSLKVNISLLIIDDEEGTREGLVFQLERQGYIMHSASSAEIGLRILKEKHVDLVVSDVAMPQMNGLVLLDEIRSLYPELPVILLTGFGSVEMAVDAMKRGAMDFIAKPASFSEISVRIEKALEGVARKKAYLLLKDQVEELKKTCDDFGKSSGHDFQSKKLEAMGVIVSGIAHEINNPLTAVIGYSQLLMDSGGQDMSRQLKVVRDQAQRCAKIIQELMFFARRRKPVFSTIHLREVIESSIQETKGDMESRKVSIFFSAKVDDFTMPGDGALLKKVFSQILLNAAHALESIKEGRKVEVRVTDEAAEFKIEIQDNGPGIPQEHLGRIFDPFFSTKEVGRGTGLGLSLCYGLIADHGGRITVKNQKPGALFTILLPKSNSAVSPS